ncbi:MAG: Hsp20/alpha crystallin family protein [Bacteroidota bacterium]
MSLIRRYKRPVSVFDNLWNEIFDQNFPTTVTKGNFFSQPNVNIKETADAFELELAAPGLSKEDFTIDIQNDYLQVKVEQKEAASQQEDQYTRKEFNYTSFKRSFHLPTTVETAGIAAKYENGILNVHLPKKEEAQAKAPKLIEIK